MHPPKVVEKLEKRIARLSDWRYGKLADVALEMAETADHRRQPPEDLAYRPAPVGTKWGEEWSTAWFRGVACIPEPAAGRRVHYRHVSFSEKLLFVDGVAFAGMNPHHTEVLLTPRAQGGESSDLAVEAYSGHRMAWMDPCSPGLFYHQICGMDPGEAPPHTLEASELLVEREQTASLFHDAKVLYGAAVSLEERSLRRAAILDTLNQALDRVPFTWESDEELEAAAASARELLAPLLAQPNAPTTPGVGIVGYGHIDLAWLWPMGETIRKAARTFTTHLALMDDYPEFVCVQSQPILIEMIAEHYPELLPRIEAAVQRGQWEPNGAMWVEADCNVTGGEALVRQFLEGHKAAARRFGYESDVLWLPDVFGYSAALPQIARRCGINAFVTSKINWNDTTRFPYDTFEWEGLDGSAILTHFITARLEGYNADVGPEFSWDCWNHVQHREVQDRVLCPIGYGDGGGGVTRDMLERARRMGDLEGCPKTSFTSVSASLDGLREQNVTRPRWVGELYLELHRGTYTSEGRIKRYNRKIELLFRDVELFSAMAMATGFSYPAEELEKLWRVLLANQCHDNLAGSCIRVTCEEIESEHADVQCRLEALRTDALGALAQSIEHPAATGSFLVANSLSWPRTSLVYLEGCDGGAVDAHGEPLTVQPCRVGDAPSLAVRVSAPGLGATAIALEAEAAAAPSPFEAGDSGLDTPFYSVAFDGAGKITGLLDKEAGREVVQPGRRLNDLYSAEDVPIYWDAFDIEAYYRDVVRPEDRLVSREVIADGPLLIAYRSVYAVGRASTLTQDMVFYAHSRRIDFRSEVDWHERNRLLKAGFPVDVHSSTYRNEIQFGHLVRNRHANAPQDQAQFEVCAHKWVDLSESAYGVALLNDCKYGHDSLDNMISLTLLRSAGGANEEGDEGRHEFTYALLPHPGGFSVEQVVREAYDLNVPLTSLPMEGAQGGASETAFCAVSNPNVIIEAVKKAEESDALVVRVYEAGHSRGPVALTFAAPIAHAAECNLLERGDQPVAVDGACVSFEIRPFEIRTFKVVLRAGS